MIIFIFSYFTRNQFCVVHIQNIFLRYIYMNYILYKCLIMLDHIT